MPPLRAFTLTLPPGLRLLNANQRPHHRVRAEITASIRGAAMEACTHHPGLRAALAETGPEPLLRHAYLLGVLHLPTRRRADPANWYPSFKAAVDGIVDAGVLADDDHTHVIGPDMRIGPIARGGRLTLHVQELTPEQHAAFRWTREVA
jgi:crossover junction endodeoxyribonuclease RusA